MAIDKKYGAFLNLTCIFIVLGTLQQTAASQQANTPQPEANEGMEQTVKTERQIALDFVSVLLQVKNMAPDTTTLHMPPPQDTFAANLGHFLDMSGYKVVLSEKVNSAISIDYFISDKSTGQNIVKTYQVNIGQLKLRRDYIISANVARPQTAMFVQGTDTSEIELNDEIFDFSVEEKEDFESYADRNSQSPAKLSVVTVDSKNQYRTGDAIVLNISISHDSRIYCYYKDGHGQIVKIFPNRFTTDNRLNANQSVAIPSNDNWSINATRIGATDDFLCIATDPDNESLISVLNKEPDFEPLAARSLDVINQRISAHPNTPVISTSLSVQVN